VKAIPNKNEMFVAFLTDGRGPPGC
jgi:hypothetical protein